MKIKLDENLPAELLDLFTVNGHDTHSVISEGLAGQDDQTIFATAVREQRFFITQDLDFSDVRKFSPGCHSGILLVRLRVPSRRVIIDRFRLLLSQYDLEGWSQCFVVLSEQKLRVHKPSLSRD